jgi:hypothetical protein
MNDMKKNLLYNGNILILSILISLFSFSGCLKVDNPIKFPKGIFPDTTLSMKDVNSDYDDYNIGMYVLSGSSPFIFSSNRKSAGGQFDLEQGSFSFTFDQTDGSFSLSSEMSTDEFLTKLINAAKTSGNDFGPYRLFSTADGYEYLILSSATTAGDLDLKYLRNRPAYSAALPAVEGPFPIKLLNSASDDAYLSFDANQDSAYFTSNKGGNFDIYVSKRPADKDIATWFNMDYSAAAKADSVNSTSDDKCPLIFRNIMVFTSNRPGGLGGFDLYYSIFRKGKWSSPVNMGPSVNTTADEYRPVLGYHPDFSNLFMMFSSNRSGGKGGFDLYFRGVTFP